MARPSVKNFVMQPWRERDSALAEYREDRGGRSDSDKMDRSIYCMLIGSSVGRRNVMVTPRKRSLESCNIEDSLTMKGHDCLTSLMSLGSLTLDWKSLAGARPIHQSRKKLLLAHMFEDVHLNYALFTPSFIIVRMV